MTEAPLPIVVLPTTRRPLKVKLAGFARDNSYAFSLLLFGGLLMLGGRAGDILGRRRMFSAGIMFFTLASLLGGFATNSSLLITARVLQGVGAALAAPAGLSLIAVTFPEGKLRTRALGMYAAMTGLGERLARRGLVADVFSLTRRFRREPGWSWRTSSTAIDLPAAPPGTLTAAAHQ